MIFGKTYEEERLKRYAFLNKYRYKREKCFALWPQFLEDGRIIWLSYFYIDHDISLDVDCKSLYSGIKTYHLEDKKN